MTNVDLLYQKIDRGREGKNIGLKTGIPKMDSYTGGIQPVYTLIYGVSGCGKSAYALYSYIYRPLKDYPDKNIKLCYFSLELSTELLLAKLLCLYIFEEFGRIIPFTKLMSWSNILDDDDYDYVVKARNWLESINSRLIIYDSALTSSFFYSKVKGLLEENGKFYLSPDGRRTLYTKNDPEQIVIVVVDHLNLTTPMQGRSKKEEIDLVSKYAVTLRNQCSVSFVMLMQENRNSSSMDRRKADLTECSSEDIADTSTPFQDSEICIGIYYPLKFKLKTHKEFPIIVDDKMSDFEGLRGRYRSLQLIKNRQGESEKAVPVNFFGEIGYWNQFPKVTEIKDFKKYLSLNTALQEEEEDNSAVEESTGEIQKPLIFSF